jgi:hypothetical protein
MSEKPTEHLMGAAIAYAERGVPVFPLTERGKTPLTIRGFKDATTDVSTVRAWWTRWPAANIGVPTGLDSTFDVVDIDPRHGGDVSLDALVAKHGPTPETPESMTGGGGRHLCFRHTDGFRNSAGAIGPGIDTRGTGGYIVVPPSVTKAPYQWEASSDLFDVPLADLPEWLNPAKAKGSIGAPEGAGNLDFTAGPVKADGAPVVEGGRNHAAASLAGQWIQAGDSVRTVLDKLRAWNSTNKPPLPDREISSVAASVAITHSRNNPGAAVPIVDPPDEPQHDETTAPTEDDEGYRAAQPPPAAKFPDDLLDPPGFVGEICRWINGTAYMPQPALTLGNVLAFLGAVVGRKVQVPSGLRTNLYCMGVGDSGCGKDHSRQKIKQICDAAGLTEQILGGEDISSDAAILGAVHEHPSILFQWDEIGHLIANTTSRYAAVHQRAIAPTLTKLFSSASGKMLGKEYAGRKEQRKDIDQPNVCMYGTTVPGRLFEGLTPGEIADGFLGRMLVFQSDDPEPKEQDVETSDPPESIVQMVQAWASWQPPAAGGGNIAAAVRHVPYRVQLEAEAVAAIRQFRARCKVYKKETRGTGLDPLWSRAVEHVNKVALVVACGERFGDPIISGSTAAWSIKLVEHLVGSLVATVKDSVAGSDFERDLLYVLRAIRKAGAGGLSQSQLLLRTRRLTPKVRQDILNQLVSSGDVVKGERKSPKGGPAAMIYKAA